jgi:pyridoxine/pyridoxamine 5'-phosphate oxidase
MKPLRPCDGDHPKDAVSDGPTEIARSPANSGEPDHYNSLDAVKREAFALLSRGVSDRRSGFHTPLVVTHGLDGFPAARTVVLRGFDPNVRTITIHSDIRSGKAAEIIENDRAAAVFYDARKRF